MAMHFYIENTYMTLSMGKRANVQAYRRTHVHTYRRRLDIKVVRR